MSLSRRVPLRRKTPLKRSGSLRKVSAGKAVWNRAYAKALGAAKEAQVAATGSTYCERCGLRGLVEGHHIAGRIGARILEFSLVCGPCHKYEIHGRPNAARAEGWLAPRGNAAGGER